MTLFQMAAKPRSRKRMGHVALDADYREGPDLKIPSITARSTNCTRELAASFVFAASTWACTVFDDRPRIRPI